MQKCPDQHSRVECEEEAWLSFHCENCGLTWQQHSIHLAKCIKCGSTFVSVIAAKAANGKRDIESGIWKCEKCGVRLISKGKPTGHNKCDGTEFAWEGILRSGAWHGDKRTHRCHDCYKEIPKDGPSRCKECYEKRKVKREKIRQYPMRCLKCGQRYKVGETPEACKCGGTGFRKDW
jgi:DNA-directed RNA polymerase subunit RPC12/RpoP